MTKKTFLELLIIFLFLTGPFVVNSHAAYSFYNITNNSVIDAATGEAQLFLEVVNLYDTDIVTFTFNNIGPNASSITDIYFDDNVPLLVFDSTLGIDGFQHSDGVSFSAIANPVNLPGGQDFSFGSNVSDYDFDSDSETQPNGVNPGEFLSIYFRITEDNTFDELLTALSDASFRVGIHVQGFANDGSESFINNTPGTSGSQVPEPATMLLLGFGLIGLAGISRRKK